MTKVPDDLIFTREWSGEWSENALAAAREFSGGPEPEELLRWHLLQAQMIAGPDRLVSTLLLPMAHA